MSNFYLCDYCAKLLGPCDVPSLLSDTCKCDADPKPHPKKPIDDTKTPREVCKDYE